MIICICLGAVAVGVILGVKLRMLHNSKRVCPECWKPLKKKYAMAFMKDYGWQLFGRMAKWFVLTQCGCRRKLDSGIKFFNYIELLWRLARGQFRSREPRRRLGIFPRHSGQKYKSFGSAARLISQHTAKPPPSGHYRVLAHSSLRPGAR